MSRTITELYAFVMVDGEGDEGIPAFQSANTMFPMVGADMEKIESMKPMAQAIANLHQAEIKILKFTGFTVTDVIQPKKGRRPQ